MSLNVEAQNVDARHGVWTSIGRDQVFTMVYGDQINTVVERNAGAAILHKASAPGAAFDSADRHPAPKCSPGTRVEVLKTISDWLENCQGQRIFWLHGPAGSGKSAIAQTVAEICAEAGILGASFFFSRKSLQRSVSKHFFSTIASQLAVSVPAAKSAMYKALEDDPSIPDKVLRDQLRYLITNPFLALQGPWIRPIVLVIDSLDECQEKDLVREIILLVVNALYQHQLPFQVLFTSRAESHIQREFHKLRSTSDTTRWTARFLDLNSYSADCDIRAFLLEKFVTIYNDNVDYMSFVENPWPGEDDLEVLVAKSAGLFIFASTVVKMIDVADSSPENRLKMVLNVGRASSTSAETSLTFSDLDLIYLDILAACPKGTQSIIGIIIHLANPLSLKDLTFLIENETPDVGRRLHNLRSILFVPESSESDEPVHIYHTSFQEFLTDVHRSGDFFIDKHCYHSRIAHLCIKLMNKNLRRNICGIDDPSMLNVELPDLEGLCDKHISPALRYACRYWAFHLSQADENLAIIADLEIFATRALLYWIETLSLLGELKSAISGLQDIKKWAQRQADTHPILSALFKDAERFILEFFDVISISSLHIYYSALPFTPTKTALRLQYEHEIQNTFRVLHCLEDGWSACLRVIKLSSCVRSVVFSPDGKFLVSWSDEEGLRLWSTASGQHIADLYGQNIDFRCVLFSQDGKHIAASSLDGTPLMWDAATAQASPPLAKHEDAITSIAISPDNTMVASASQDKTVRLWDVVKNQSVVLQGHEDVLTSVIFCNTGSRIASSSADTTIRVWDTIGCLQRVLRGHASAVNSIDFAPKGQQIVSGSDDMTVRLWSVVDGALIRTFKGYHQMKVTSVKFYDESHIVATSADRSVSQDTVALKWDLTNQSAPVCLWSLRLTTWVEAFQLVLLRLKSRTTGSPWATPLTFSDEFLPFAYGFGKYLLVSNVPSYRDPAWFLGHWQDIHATAVSANGILVASGSSDKTIHIWDAFARPLTMHTVHLPLPYGLSFFSLSPDGNRIILSFTVAPWVTLWNSSGKLVNTLWQCSYASLALNNDESDIILFSPDSSTIVRCTRKDGVVSIFNATNGRQLRKINVSNGTAISVTFSSDGTCIASGYSDGTVRLWEISTGSLLASHSGHSSPAGPIAFSSESVIASGSHDGQVLVWHVAESSWTPCEGHHTPITSVLFSIDGLYLATGADDGSIRVWYTKSGQLEKILEVEGSARVDVGEEDVTGGIQGLLFISDWRLRSVDTTGAVSTWDLKHPSGAAVVQPESAAGLWGNTVMPQHMLHDDGWLFNGQKRLCWVPKAYRPHGKKLFVVEQGERVYMGSEDTPLLALDFDTVPAVPWKLIRPIALWKLRLLDRLGRIIYSCIIFSAFCIMPILSLFGMTQGNVFRLSWAVDDLIYASGLEEEFSPPGSW